MCSRTSDWKCVLCSHLALDAAPSVAPALRGRPTVQDLPVVGGGRFQVAPCRRGAASETCSDLSGLILGILLRGLLSPLGNQSNKD